MCAAFSLPPPLVLRPMTYRRAPRFLVGGPPGRSPPRRALAEVGDQSIAETRDVLASIDSPGKTPHETLGKAQHAVTPSLQRKVDGESWVVASRQLEGVVTGTLLGDAVLAALRRLAQATYPRGCRRSLPERAAVGETGRSRGRNLSLPDRIPLVHAPS
jgi:hypothetical protein